MDTQSLELCLENLARLRPPLDKILSFARREESSARHLAALCEAYPDLAARILALVNSPTLGCRQPVPMLLQAAVILGINRIRNLAVGAHLVDTLPFSSGKLDSNRFFRHTFAVAAVARAVGQAGRSKDAEDMYLAGLLHDVGIVILLEAFPVEYPPILTRARAGEARLQDEEAALFGTTHAEVASELARRWALEEKVLSAIRSHHQEFLGVSGGVDAEARETADALLLAEMTCRHHGWGLVRARAPFPEGVSLSDRIPAFRQTILEKFSALVQVSEETRRLIMILRK
jgi:putative nucleotidyltransferase with HDIG domain